MENKVSSRSFLPILIVFIVSTLFIFLVRQLAEGRFDFRVLLVGNILLFGVTAISFRLYARALRNSNAHAFVRTMYVSLLVKLFVCLLATLLYAWFAGRGVDKNSILACFGLYILYTWLEVRILMISSKKSPKNV